MADDPLRRKPGAPRPQIWVSGGQRPPFSLSALGRATVHIAREGVAPLNSWAARMARRVAINVSNGAGRIPEAKLGRAARFVPSHLRVAGWIKNLAAVLAHASATADPDVRRGNALVAEIEPHLWPVEAPPAAPPAPPAPSEPAVGPVVLAEPRPQADDPLAAIRPDLGGAEEENLPLAAQPPRPPGQIAQASIQVGGYLLGWLGTALALPYGLARALWLYAKGQDLRTIGTAE